MAALGFGVSYGDFAKAIRVIDEIRRAIQDSGVEDEYNHVLMEIQHLQIVLEYLACGKWDEGGNHGHLNAVKGMALSCQIPLQKFLRKLQEYNSLGKGLRGLRQRTETHRLRLKWCFEIKAEADKFLATISRKVVLLNLLLSSNLTSTTSKLGERVRRIEHMQLKPQLRTDYPQAAFEQLVAETRHAVASQTSTIHSQEASNRQYHAETTTALKKAEESQKEIISISTGSAAQVATIATNLGQLSYSFASFSSLALHLFHLVLDTNRDVCMLLQQIQNGIPRAPSTPVKDCFKFTDALGRCQYLDCDLFKHWELFEGMLKIKFREIPGERRVLDRKYNLLNKRGNNLIIDNHKWERSIFPGTEVYMSMIVSAELVRGEMCPQGNCGGEIHRMSSMACPKCGTEFIYYDMKEKPCSDLDLMINFENLEEASRPDAMIKNATESLPQTLTRSTTHISLPELIDSFAGSHSRKEELTFFKAIHISFGSDSHPGLRTGFPIPDGQVSLQVLRNEGFFASQWRICDTLRWLDDNNFPPSFQGAFQKLSIHGHRWFRLAEDTGLLEWELVSTSVDKEIWDGTPLSLERLRAELERLSRGVRQEIRRNRLEIT